MNAQNLMRLIRNNERAMGFDLSNWTHTCGTFGCLVGNDHLAGGIPRVGYRSAACEYGISFCESVWLFMPTEPLRHAGGLAIERDDTELSPLLGGPKRPCRDAAVALSRVRKFLYYKLHKQEMLYDERGCIRETARRQEGNWNVLSKVKAEVTERKREPVEA